MWICPGIAYFLSPSQRALPSNICGTTETFSLPNCLVEDFALEPLASHSFDITANMALGQLLHVFLLSLKFLISILQRRWHSWLLTQHWPAWKIHSQSWQYLSVDPITQSTDTWDSSTCVLARSVLTNPRHSPTPTSLYWGKVYAMINCLHRTAHVAVWT